MKLSRTDRTIVTQFTVGQMILEVRDSLDNPSLLSLYSWCYDLENISRTIDIKYKYAFYKDAFVISVYELKKIIVKDKVEL